MTNNNNKTAEEIRELEKRLKSLKKNAKADKGSVFMVPVAILVAGLLIAGAVVYSRGGETTVQREVATSDNTAQQPPAPTPPTRGSADNIRPVSKEDHIRGNPDALVKLVEFSDLECPFCKRFHPTMQRIMDEYGEDGRVAWVYRHFPLDSIHSKARREAAAAELAGELGGNEKFWEYVDKIFEITPSNNKLDLNLLVQIAEDIGLPRQPFEDFIKEDDVRGGKYASHVEDDYQDSLASGGTGTPYSVVIAPNGKKFSITGAQPYSAVRSIIELALKETN